MARYGLTAADLIKYEEAGVLLPIRVDGNVYYEGWELRLSVIAKAEQLGFEFEEILALLRMWTEP